MDFGIFNLMGSREADKPTAQVFGEVAEQTRLADALGYTIAWFAEHHFSNYCLCASPLMMVAHCASITKRIRLGTAVVVLPLYNPARLAADIAQNREMTEEFCDILDLAFSRDFFSYHGKHYRMPDTHIPARPVQNPLPIYVAGHTQAMFRTAARQGCALPRTRAIRRGSPPASGAARKSCKAPCWSTSRSPTSRRSKPSTT